MNDYKVSVTPKQFIRLRLADALYAAVHAEGTTFSDLSRSMGRSQNYLHEAVRTGRLNGIVDGLHALGYEVLISARKRPPDQGV